jgi:hypothetical protein
VSYSGTVVTKVVPARLLPMMTGIWLATSFTVGVLGSF